MPTGLGRKTAIAGIALAMATPASAQGLSAEEAAALRNEIATLKAQVERLEQRLDAAGTPAAPVGTAAASPAQVPAPAGGTPVQSASAAPGDGDVAIDWKGSPRFSEGLRSFKVKGRIQMDAGYVSVPPAIDDKAKGFVNEVRRIRLGGEGTLGGGFGYKLETELSDNKVDLVDTYITYEKDRWLVMLGNQNAFQSLDELIGDTSGSVMERAAFTDAFGFERRLGLSVQYRAGMLLAQGGVFSDSVDSLTDDEDGDENNSYGLDGRLVVAPKVGKAQLHFAGSYHWRRLGTLSETPLRYRQRAFLHANNMRFLATPTIDGKEEVHYGLEAAGVMGRLHFAGETHWLNVARPGAADPTFFGGYAEVGYFLTKGDSRGYKGGIFTNKAPKRPLGKDGIGSIQVTLRYDYLDLDDRDIAGGKQNAYIAAIIWSPIEYLRFNANYAHIDYAGAAILAGTRSNYGVDVMGLRAELDF